MTKRQLGLSVYPNYSNLEDDERYLKKAAQFGFSKVFMSLLEVNENQDQVLRKYAILIQFAKNLNYQVTLDIAPAIFKQLGISYEDLSFFSELGADAIRLDQGFDGQKEAMMSYNEQQLTIELNMSNDVSYLDNILTYQANKPYISGCHNFYPQAGTGLPLAFFKQCSERFRKHNIDTAAFVTASEGNVGPWSINDGLPTLEMHRNLPITIQCKHLFATGLIDTVIIGNAYATDNELAEMGAINRYQTVFSIELESDISSVERQIILNNQHFRRGDITDQVIRSTEVRKIYQTDNPQHGITHQFKRGDVVIGNNQFGKYQNELQIVLADHEDIRKNKVGAIVANEQFLLETINPWSKFRFEVHQNG